MEPTAGRPAPCLVQWRVGYICSSCRLHYPMSLLRLALVPDTVLLIMYPRLAFVNQLGFDRLGTASSWRHLDLEGSLHLCVA